MSRPETTVKQVDYLLSLLGELYVNAGVREQTVFLLFVFLIVCVLYSRTCLIFVVAFITGNRQLFFSFDILQKFMFNKKRVRTCKGQWVFSVDAQPGCHMSAGEVLV